MHISAKIQGKKIGCNTKVCTLNPKKPNENILECAKPKPYTPFLSFKEWKFFDFFCVPNIQTFLRIEKKTIILLKKSPKLVMKNCQKAVFSLLA